MISVIVPVYNVEKYLRKCVDSILNQREPLTSARESLKAMRVIFAALESARTGEKITVQQE